MQTSDSTRLNPTQDGAFSESDSSSDFLLDAAAPARPTEPVAKPWRGPARSMGERADRDLARLRSTVYDLQSQLDAARAELEAARQDGALALPGLIRREARRLGVDVRQSARDLYGALLLDRAHSAKIHGVDGKLIDQVRNSLDRAVDGEITADEALATIRGALGWRDDELALRLAEARAVHPGPPSVPCRECGQQIGTNASDCSPCAVARPDFFVGAS